jgi:hypothetical protein
MDEKLSSSVVHSSQVSFISHKVALPANLTCGFQCLVSYDDCATEFCDLGAHGQLDNKIITDAVGPQITGSPTEGREAPRANIFIFCMLRTSSHDSHLIKS